jgi:pSer/pThr/pTyr-binding forkhead associated (FHA) protein
VSRHHAQIVTTVDGSWIEDLNSTNGIFVRGKRVRRHRLAEGEVVKIGLHDLAYFRSDPKATATVVLEPDHGEDEDDVEADEVRDA